MKPYWKDAPDGSTHINKDSHVVRWYRNCGQKWYYWSESEDIWFPSRATDIELKNLIKIRFGEQTQNKYHRQLKGVTVDVYDVLKAFDVKCPALQHLSKKALCAGLRGHKDVRQDLLDIIESAKRALELHDEDE